MIVLAFVFLVQSGDAESAIRLRDRGAKVVEAQGSVTSVEADDCSKWSEDDFKALGRLARLKNLSMGAGLSDATLPLLAGLEELEVFQTNLSAVSDDGVKGFLPLKNLRTLKFFHPGKAFTGAGLARLAELPRLTSLTVAGSLAFGDEGMAAVAKLPRLTEFRTWHAGSTIEGLKKLTALPALKSLTLGQRLAYAPPVSVSDEAIPVLLDLKSIESLQLEEARLSPDVLLRLKELPGLKRLTLAGIDLTEADAERVKAGLAGVDVRWTAPNEAYQKRIRALFGGK